MKEMIPIERAKQRLQNEMFRALSAMKKRREEMVDRARFFNNAIEQCEKEIKEVEAMYKAMFGQDMADVNGWQEPINADSYEPVATFDASGEVRLYDNHYPNYPKKARKPNRFPAIGNETNKEY
jgi:hypothetical protein